MDELTLEQNEKKYRIIGLLLGKPEYVYINTKLLAGIVEDTIIEYLKLDKEE